MSSTALVPTSQTATQTNIALKSSSPLSLASSSLPALNLTPKRDTITPIKSETPRQTGQWVHPRMGEVIRRRNATNFDNSNMKTVLYSSGMIIASLFVPSLVWSALPTTWFRSIQPYLFYTLWTLRALFTSVLANALRPLLTTPDACEDVPLTPQQRQLLGLPAMTRPATPQEKDQYVTPPRYPRNSTPRSSPASSVRAEAPDSPLSGRGTPMSGSASPFANSPAQGGIWRTDSGNSLLGGADELRSGGERRRLSYLSNRSSPLSFSEFDTSFGVGGTPTKEKKASVGLNNKWLYEKGRGSPRLSGGLSGSVFS